MLFVDGNALIELIELVLQFDLFVNRNRHKSITGREKNGPNSRIVESKIFTMDHYLLECIKWLVVWLMDIPLIMIEVVHSFKIYRT